MKRLIGIATLVLLAAQTTFAFPAGRSVPPESFLDYHVDTAPQLTFEVAYDPAVRARFARHFHLSGPDMSQYVARNLALMHLKAPLKTRVYCITPSGHEYYVMMTLHTGAAVFANAAGKPILRLVCGNPLVPALPKPKMVALLTKPAIKSAVEGALQQQVAPTLASQSVLATASGAGLSAPVIATVGPGEAVFTAGGVSSVLSWLPLAGGIFTGVVTSGHSSGASNSPFTPNTPTTPAIPTTPTTPITPNSPPAAPEPSPALVLVFGGLCLAAVRIRQMNRVH